MVNHILEIPRLGFGVNCLTMHNIVFLEIISMDQRRYRRFNSHVYRDTMYLLTKCDFHKNVLYNYSFKYSLGIQRKKSLLFL